MARNRHEHALIWENMFGEHKKWEGDKKYVLEILFKTHDLVLFHNAIVRKIYYIIYLYLVSK